MKYDEGITSLYLNILLRGGLRICTGLYIKLTLLATRGRITLPNCLIMLLKCFYLVKFSVMLLIILGIVASQSMYSKSHECSIINRLYMFPMLKYRPLHYLCDEWQSKITSSSAMVVAHLGSCGNLHVYSLMIILNDKCNYNLSLSGFLV